MSTGLSTRDRILREASLLFTERGFHGTTTRDIAEAVGIRQPSLFHHFDSKHAIMADLQRLELEPALARIAEVAALDASPAVRLYRYFFEDVRRLFDSPLFFAGTHTPWVMRDPRFAAARADFDRLMAAQEQLIEDGVRGGELIDVDPAMVNRAIVWMLDGALIEESAGGESDGATYAHQLATFALRALLVDGSRIDEIRRAAGDLGLDPAVDGASPGS